MRQPKKDGSSGLSLEYGYDNLGNLDTMIDALGRKITLGYDAFNRPTSIGDPLGNVMTITYDNMDRITGMTDPRGNTTAYAFNGIGDPLSEVSPERGTMTRTVDAAGQTATASDGRGVKVSNASFIYDTAGRISSTTYLDKENVSWQYDTGANGIGRLAKMTDATGSTSWQYDLDGRVTKKTVILRNQTFTTDYQYTAGRLTQLTTPTGQVLTYSYSAGNQLSTINLNGKLLVSNITYTPTGAIAGWVYGNGQSLTRTFDVDGRLQSFTLPFVLSGATALGTRSISYDLGGQITALSDSANGTGLGSQSFGYDGAGHLISATVTNRASLGNIPDQRFTYDGAGNRLSLTVTNAAPALALSGVKGNGSTNYVIENNSNREVAPRI